MARLASIGVGGYFPTPQKIIPSIASFFQVYMKKSSQYSKPSVSFLDPCAGEGTAILELAKTITGFDPLTSNEYVEQLVYLNELEQVRHKTLHDTIEKKHWKAAQQVLNCDAFRVKYAIKGKYESHRGVDIAFLNPPYDLDPVYGRLEQAFLERFTNSISQGEGWLIFVVPFYALKASAQFLSDHYNKIEVYKFPEDLFQQFKQVVLFARRSTGNLISANYVETLQSYADNSDLIPYLPSFFTKKETITPHGLSGLGIWEAQGLDSDLIKNNYIPFGVSDPKSPHYHLLGLDFSVSDGLQKTYQVVMPPKPGHIAYGIASGVFNGVTLTSNDKKLPEILVKGVFQKKFKTIEEKKKDGEVIAEVQVQQPTMKVHGLNLETYQYFSFLEGVSVTEAKELDKMTLADFIEQYGKSLYSTLLDQCRPLHNPEIDPVVILPVMKRELFDAQKHAYSAAVKLLSQGQNIFLLGEVGSGKSIISCALIESLSERNIQETLSDIKSKNLSTVHHVLVLCPPHLIDNWKNEILFTIPGASVFHIESISDLDKITVSNSVLPGGNLAFAILSRETAKLGSSIESSLYKGRCPTCHHKIEETESNIISKRLHCDHKVVRPQTSLSSLFIDLASYFRAQFDGSQLDELLFNDNFVKLCRKKENISEFLYEKVVGSSYDNSFLKSWIRKTMLECGQEKKLKTFIDPLQYLLLWLKPQHRIQLLNEILAIYPQCVKYYTQEQNKEVAYELHQLIYSVALQDNILEVSDSLQSIINDSTIDEYQRKQICHAMISNINDMRESVGIESSLDGGNSGYSYQYRNPLRCEKESKVITLQNTPEQSTACIQMFLQGMFSICKFSFTPCNEFLYQASASPRRYPIATYISKYRKELFDFMIIDEGQEYNSNGSAQEKAAHRLTELGKPAIILSGSIMNGYARSLFRNFWALSKNFREEFAYKEERDFVNLYGYKKQIIDHQEKESKKPRIYGSVTDRTENNGIARQAGDAPGILPSFIMRYLLPSSVVIHKIDLNKNLPICKEIPERVFLTNAQQIENEYNKLLSSLKLAIKKDRFNPDLMGKLLGALSELPSYLDRCIEGVGNVAGEQQYIIKYPDNVGGEIVETAKLFPKTIRTPKEQWLLGKVKSELAEGRNCIIYLWHTGNNNSLPKRLQSILSEDLKESAIFLDATKVSPKKRQSWIDKEVVKAKKRIMIVNPVAVQTGLNNLVWFSTAIWMENPVCNAILYRQANGRLDRIGQTKEVRLYFPYYENTLQTATYRLLLKKVAVSMQADGLDASAALIASGADTNEQTDSLSIGKLLYDYVFKDDLE